MSDRLRISTVVRTTRDAGRTDWVDNAAARRRPWGACGMVLAVHDSHGLCYKVGLLGGGHEFYEHDEVESVAEERRE